MCDIENFQYIYKIIQIYMLNKLNTYIWWWIFFFQFCAIEKLAIFFQ